MAFQRDLTGNSNLYANVILNTNVCASSVSTTNLSATNASITNLTANTFTYGNISTPNVIATNGYFSNLYISSYNISTLTTSQIYTSNLSASRIDVTTVSNLQTTQGSTTLMIKNNGGLIVKDRDTSDPSLIQLNYTSAPGFETYGLYLEANKAYGAIGSGLNCSLQFYADTVLQAENTSTTGWRLYSSLNSSYKVNFSSASVSNLSCSTITASTFTVTNLSVSSVSAYSVSVATVCASYAYISYIAALSTYYNLSRDEYGDLYTMATYTNSSFAGQRSMKTDGFNSSYFTWEFEASNIPKFLINTCGISASNIQTTGVASLTNISSSYISVTNSITTQAMTVSTGILFRDNTSIPLWANIHDETVGSTRKWRFDGYKTDQIVFAVKDSGGLTTDMMTIADTYIYSGNCSFTVSSISTSKVSVSNLSMLLLTGTQANISTGNFSSLNVSTFTPTSVIATNVSTTNLSVITINNLSNISTSKVITARCDGLIVRDMNTSGTAYFALNYDNTTLTDAYGLILEADQTDGAVISAGYQLPLTVTLDGVSQLYNTCAGGFQFYNTINSSFRTNFSSVSVSNLSVSTLTGTTITGTTTNGTTINGSTINGSTINASTLSTTSITVSSISTSSVSTTNISNTNFSSANASVTNITGTTTSFTNVRGVSFVASSYVSAQYTYGVLGVITSVLNASNIFCSQQVNASQVSCSSISTAQIYSSNTSFINMSFTTGTGTTLSVSTLNVSTIAGTVSLTNLSVSTSATVQNMCVSNLWVSAINFLNGASALQYGYIQKSGFDLAIMSQATGGNVAITRIGNNGNVRFDVGQSGVSCYVSFYASTGNFSTLSVSTFNPTTITTTTLSASTGNFSTLNASTWTFPSTISTTTFNGSTGNFSNLNTCNIYTSSLNIKDAYSNIQFLSSSSLVYAEQYVNSATSTFIEAFYPPITKRTTIINGNNVMILNDTYVSIPNISSTSISTSVITGTTMTATTVNGATVNASTFNVSTFSPATIATTTLSASTGNFSTLNASTWNLPSSITVSSLNACNISTLNFSVTSMTVSEITNASKFTVSNISATNLTLVNITSVSAITNASKFTVSYVSANAITASDINVSYTFTSELYMSGINNSFKGIDPQLPVTIYSVSNTFDTGLRVPTYLDSYTLGALTLGYNQTTGFINVCRATRFYDNVLLTDNINGINATNSLAFGNNITSGTVRIGNLTMTGNISLNTSTGNINISSVSGNINLNTSTDGTINFITTNGAINFSTSADVVFNSDRRSTWNTSDILPSSTQLGSFYQQSAAATTSKTNTGQTFVFSPQNSNVSLTTVPVGLYLVSGQARIKTVGGYNASITGMNIGSCYGGTYNFTSGSTTRQAFASAGSLNTSGTTDFTFCMSFTGIVNMTTTGNYIGAFMSATAAQAATVGSLTMGLDYCTVVKIA